jgi:MFS family permease
MYQGNVARATARITGTLFVTQSLSSAAFIAYVTVYTIVGALLSGNDAWAGLPVAINQLGAAAAAYPAGRFMQRYGRRPGLTIGMLSGALGMTLVLLALVLMSFPVFVVGVLLNGFSRGIGEQARYAAADAVPPHLRSRAISTVVFAGTVGAVGGPLMVGPLGQFAQSLGLLELAGPMISGAVLYLLAGMILQIMLHPDPHTIAQHVAAEQQVLTDARIAAGTQQPELPARTVRQVLSTRIAQLALVSLIVGQAVMQLIMSVTSLYMKNNAHPLSDISLVIGAHTLGMFGLSMFTGQIADRIGRPATVVIGAALLVLGALIAPVSLATSWLALALFLVGVGWNLCYIAGSALLADAARPNERGRVQGSTDLMVNLASASGGLSSGAILASTNFFVLCAIGAAVSLLPALMALPLIRRKRPGLAAAD